MKGNEDEDDGEKDLILPTETKEQKDHNREGKSICTTKREEQASRIHTKS